MLEGVRHPFTAPTQKAKHRKPLERSNWGRNVFSWLRVGARASLGLWSRKMCRFNTSHCFLRATATIAFSVSSEKVHKTLYPCCCRAKVRIGQLIGVLMALRIHTWRDVRGCSQPAAKDGSLPWRAASSHYLSLPGRDKPSSQPVESFMTSLKHSCSFWCWTYFNFLSLHLLSTLNSQAVVQLGTWHPAGYL